MTIPGPVVRPEGDVDQEEAQNLQAELLALTPLHQTVIADLTRTTYFSSLAVSALVVAKRDADRHGHEVVVHVAPGSIVQRVLEICMIPFEFVSPSDAD